MTLKARKRDHLELCIHGQVEFKEKTTLLEAVEFVHHALPQLSWEEVDTTTCFLNKRLRAPLIIPAMTGGLEVSGEINRALASVAEKLGIGIGLGSQRAMYEHPEFTSTYQVREVAPSALLLGNLGISQAKEMDPEEVQALVDQVGADGICIHLNSLMELIQADGDRDFFLGLEALEGLVQNLRCPLVVKETGCGISREVALKLRGAGVQVVDVAGAGGTSWAGIESLRSSGVGHELGKLYWDWGIPTAASLCEVRGLGLTTIASGGLRSGLDVAKAVALGASLGGMALPILRSYHAGGQKAVEEYLLYVLKGLRVAMLLTGSADIPALQRQQVVFTGKLREWIISRGLLVAENR